MKKRNFNKLNARLDRNYNEGIKVERYVKLAHVMIGACFVFIGTLGTISGFWYSEQKDTMKEISFIKEDVATVKGDIKNLSTKFDFAKDDINFIKLHISSLSDNRTVDASFYKGKKHD